MLVRLYMVSLAFLVQLMKAEIFTSVQQMTQIFRAEMNVVNALTVYVAKTEEHLLNIRKYLHAYEQVQAEVDAPGEALTQKQEDDYLSERLAGNPIHAYNLMKRLTLDWKHIEEYDPQADWRAVEAEIEKGEIFGSSQFGNEMDLKGAAKAIIRLQKIYLINATSLVRGNVLGMQTAAELTAQDCIYLVTNSGEESTYEDAIDWFEEAYTLAGLEGNKTVTQDEVMILRTLFMEDYDDMCEVSSSENEMDSNNQFLAKDVKLGKNISQEDSDDNYAALCRGEQLMDAVYIASLKCFYDHRNAPFLTLMPAKVEQIHHDPQILVFHDIIHDNEIKLIKEISTSRLIRSTIVGAGGNGSLASDVRTSKQAWMGRNEEMKKFRNLNLRIFYLTGLLTNTIDTSSEALQIANYGIGGHFVPHRDYLFHHLTEEQKIYNVDQSDRFQGDRIATLVFYLSNVNRGGATVFPQLGVTLFPQKGSAAFWYNLKKSGVGEESSLHGACPVVHGSKWIANKWIREKNQFRQRPCGLSEDE